MNKKEKILLYGSNLWYLSVGMLGPLFAIFTQRIGGDILDISWAYATYLIITGLLAIYIGKISDEGEINKENFVVWGYIINTLFTFGYLLVNSPLGLFIIQAGLGIAVALSMPTWEALYAKNENKKHDGFEWGLAGGEAYIVTGIAMVAGGLIVNYFSFTALFLVMGSIQLIATAYIAQILGRKKLLKLKTK